MPTILNPLPVKIIGSALSNYSYTGAACTGVDGDVNRVLAVTVIPIQIFSDGMFLHPNIDYTLSDYNITFIVSIYDSQKITVFY